MLKKLPLGEKVRLSGSGCEPGEWTVWSASPHGRFVVSPSGHQIAEVDLNGRMISDPEVVAARQRAWAKSGGRGVVGSGLGLHRTRSCPYAGFTTTYRSFSGVLSRATAEQLSCSCWGN